MSVGSNDLYRAVDLTAGSSKASVDVYLVRHGQTVLNAGGLLRGLLDPPLDSMGVTEVLALGEYFSHLRPGLIVSSPLLRARATAAAIAQYCSMTFETTEYFVDRDYGNFAGKSLAEVVEEWGAVDNAPGVQPIAEVLSRARKGLDDTADRVSGGPAIIVSHDAVNSVLIASLDPGRWPSADDVVQRTGSWHLLRRLDGKWSVLAVNQRPDEVHDET